MLFERRGRRRLFPRVSNETHVQVGFYFEPEHCLARGDGMIAFLTACKLLFVGQWLGNTLVGSQHSVF